MTPHDALIADLLAHEGERFVVYDDATGKPIRKGDTLIGHPTIGCGRNLAGKGISLIESRYLLENDLRECTSDLLSFPWFEPLDEIRQRVVVELRFALGPLKFRTFTATISAIAQGKFEVAAQCLLDSKWATQVKGRAVILAEMLRTGREVEERHA